MDNQSVTFKFANNKENTIIIIIEPWAEEITMPFNSNLTVEIFYEKLGSIETISNVLGTQEYFTIWLWKGCRAKLFLDNKDVTPASLSITTPK